MIWLVSERKWTMARSAYLRSYEPGLVHEKVEKDAFLGMPLDGHNSGCVVSWKEAQMAANLHQYTFILLVQPKKRRVAASIPPSKKDLPTIYKNSRLWRETGRVHTRLFVIGLSKLYGLASENAWRNLSGGRPKPCRIAYRTVLKKIKRRTSQHIFTIPAIAEEKLAKIGRKIGGIKPGCYSQWNP